MPLDGHSYLVAQGWSGRGSGLRHGSISKPLTIPQKRTLSGLGKDRDEAFPFWDHVFNIAAKTIQVKIHQDEDESNSAESDIPDQLPSLLRTSTGLISNKRPIFGTPASSGTSTPSSSEASSSNARMSIVATAKRDAARRGLYSRFFRGPVLGPDSINEEIEETLASTSALTPSNTNMNINISGCSSQAVMNKRKEDSKIELDLEDKVKKGKVKKEKRDRKEKKKAREKQDVNEVGDKAARKLMRKEKKKEKLRKEKGKGIEGSTSEPPPSFDALQEQKRQRLHSNEGEIVEKQEKKLKRRKREREEKSGEGDLSETQKKKKRRTKEERICEPESCLTPEQEEKERRKAKKMEKKAKRSRKTSEPDSDS